jgi:outer membrane immunogenic protein
MQMKKMLIAAGAIVQMIGTQALAADMAVKTPTPPPAPVYSWAGCYVGVNGGYGWKNVNRAYNDPNTTPDPINGLGGLATIPTPTSGNRSGVLGGIDAGCNWESPQRLVFGIEGDFDFADISLSQTTSGPNGVKYPSGTGATFFTDSNSLNEQITQRWLSTIRGRIGYAVQDRLLLFATGGLAIGQVLSQGTVQLTNFGGTDVWTGANSTVKTGYAIGGGAEWALDEHWITKAEYLWYDLGNVSHSLSCVTPGICGTILYPTLGNVVSSVRGSIVRVGINYKFW